MHSTWYLYFIVFFVFLVYFPRRKRRKYYVKQFVNKKRVMKKKGKERRIMRELAERFIGKDVYMKLLEGTADGVVKEVTDSGILIENKDGIQVVNLDYIMKIREYPYKNGKRATVWGD